jgi:hypothetical protein
MKTMTDDLTVEELREALDRLADLPPARRRAIVATVRAILAAKPRAPRPKRPPTGVPSTWYHLNPAKETK